MFLKRKDYYNRGDIKLIVGLGNPGMDFKKTRHNVGFMVVDLIFKDLGIPQSALSSKFSSLFWKGVLNEKYNVIIAKPSTMINNTWQFLNDIKSYYRIKDENILLIYDEKDIPLSEFKIKKSIPNTKHNGIRGVAKYCNMQVINRIAVGIGSSEMEKMTLEKFVLGKFSSYEWYNLGETLETVKNVALDFIDTKNIDILMQSYNSK